MTYTGLESISTGAGERELKRAPGALHRMVLPSAARLVWARTRTGLSFPPNWWTPQFSYNQPTLPSPTFFGQVFLHSPAGLGLGDPRACLLSAGVKVQAPLKLLLKRSLKHCPVA